MWRAVCRKASGRVNDLIVLKLAMEMEERLWQVQGRKTMLILLSEVKRSYNFTYSH